MDPTITMRCTTIIDGRKYEFMIPVTRALWDDAKEQWRTEFLDTCRLRCAAQIRTETGIDSPSSRLRGSPSPRLGWTTTPWRSW